MPTHVLTYVFFTFYVWIRPQPNIHAVTILRL